MSHPGVTAIIPAFNEAKTIGPVVKTLVASPLVDTVLVISDGSTDRTDEVSKKAGALVHNLPVKSGKGAAMLHGVTHATTPIILFVDADLHHFTIKHVEALLGPVISGERVMNAGIRDRGAVSFFLSRFLPLISGERAMKRKIFEAVPSEYMRGFMVESALNYYCRSRGLKYGSVPMHGVTIRKKFEKVGWSQAAKEYFNMWRQITKAMVTVRVARVRGKF